MPPPLQTLLLLAALFIPTKAATPPPTSNSSRVLGGSPCPPHSQPWQAAIFKDQALLCGGVLIHPLWVLTAAHCYRQGPLMIRLGEHNLRRLDGTEQFRLSLRLSPHPKYDPKTLEHDLMLIRLRRPAAVGPAVRPLPLGTSCPTPGTKCRISGWGTITSPKRTFPQILQCAEVEVLSEQRCRQAHPKLFTPNMVCAAGTGKGGTTSDACQGDSGGPLLCSSRLQGVVSWGPRVCGTPPRPGVYVQLCRYQRWLRRVLGGAGGGAVRP